MFYRIGSNLQARLLNPVNTLLLGCLSLIRTETAGGCISLASQIQRSEGVRRFPLYDALGES